MFSKLFVNVTLIIVVCLRFVTNISWSRLCVLINFFYFQWHPPCLFSVLPPFSVPILLFSSSSLPLLFRFLYTFFAPGCKHVKGILLFGPPGCGKTLMARQIGKMLNAREPKVVNGPEILNKYVGESEANIRKLFAEAEEEQKRVSDVQCAFQWIWLKSKHWIKLFFFIPLICSSWEPTAASISSSLMSWMPSASREAQAAAAQACTTLWSTSSCLRLTVLSSLTTSWSLVSIITGRNWLIILTVYECTRRIYV